MSIKPSQRFKVLMRDGFTCAYCGRSAPEVQLVLDHIVPIAAGGTSRYDNLTTACQECNSGKSDIMLRPESDGDLIAGDTQALHKKAETLCRRRKMAVERERERDLTVRDLVRHWNRLRGECDHPASFRLYAAMRGLIVTTTLGIIYDGIAIVFAECVPDEPESIRRLRAMIGTRSEGAS